jgi:hypothetical protein
MRKLTVEEAERFRPHALSPEKAALYAPNNDSATPVADPKSL